MFDEFVDSEVSRLNAVEGSNMPTQDVIYPSALPCFFEDDDVFGLFDDAYPAFIATGIGADGTGIGFGEVIADFALFDFGFDVVYGLGEGEGIGGFGFEDMEGQPFGGLRANARKASQFLDKLINCFSIASRHNSILRNKMVCTAHPTHYCCD